MKLFTMSLLMVAFCFTDVGSANTSEIKASHSMIINYENEIRDVFVAEGFDPIVVELLVAQSKHESGNYKNGLTKYNNVFARHYHKIDTFATSAGARAEGHDRFAKYPTLRSAVLSQISYLKRKKYSFKWRTSKQFALELKSKSYYEATVEDYTSALNSYLKK